jgi:hypothetical protein
LGMWLPDQPARGRFGGALVIDIREARKHLRPGKLDRPRIVRLLALADELRGHLEAGTVNQSDLSHLYGMTRARVTQILNLLKLHPRILDYVRGLGTTVPLRAVTEHRLRALTGLPPAEQLQAAMEQVPGFADHAASTARLVDKAAK